MFNQANHFVSCVLNDEPALAPGEAGLLSIRIVEAAQRATETGQAQRL
jgi:predicted dehydrogenase